MLVIRFICIYFQFFCFFQVQLTDFENAAYVVFIVLLTRVILSYKLDFLIPLSKVKTATPFESFIKTHCNIVDNYIGFAGKQL